MFNYGNVTVMISDMDRSIEFYRDLLELKIKRQYGKDFVEFEAPGLIIGLHPNINNRTYDTKLGNVLIGFGVKDLESIVKKLSDKGIDLRIHDEGPVLLAFFTDPDGTQLYLVEEKGNFSG